MKTRIFATGILLAVALLAVAATNEVADALQKGLFEEEANHNLGAAIQAYQAVITQFDQDRQLAATAVFRLGECYRKQGSTNEATVQYERVLHEFGDQTTLIAASRQVLALFGVTPATTSAVTPEPSTDEELNEVRRIEALLRDSPDLINAPGKNGETLLQAAAAKGQGRVVQMLLDWSADVNVNKPYNLTALHYAAGNGRKTVVDLLVKHEARLDALTASGLTPLHLAVLKGYRLVAMALVEAGASVNVRSGNSVTWSHEDLQYSADERMTPLDIAIQRDYPEIIALLVNAKADLNPRDFLKPLFRAVSVGQKSIVEFLLDHGADVAGDDGTGNTPLHMAASNGSQDIVSLLLSRNANVNASNKEGSTPLHLAVEHGRTSIVKELLAHDAAVNAQDQLGRTPLHIAALRGNLEVARLLILQKPDLEHRIKVNKDGLTPLGSTALHLAVLNGSEEIADLLIKSGADVNARAYDGSTPLLLAADRRNKKLVELLLAAHADVNARDKYGATALSGLRGRPGVLEGTARPVILSSTLALQGTSAESQTHEIEQLLLKAGALRDPPRLDAIGFRRTSTFTSFPFTKDINDRNRFTLLELLAVEYNLCTRPDAPEPGTIVVGTPQMMTLSFPDFAHIQILRGSSNLSNRLSLAVDLTDVYESKDCSKDVPLEWGDVVEVPELDHVLNEKWPGLSRQVLTLLNKCLTRQVTIFVKGNKKVVTMGPEIEIENDRISFPGARPLSLRPVLLSSNLIRASSDLARVKVTRKDPATGEQRDFLVNCSESRSGPDLWLRDGDVIEVPEKP
jgi:ankyrin repeat protein